MVGVAVAAAAKVGVAGAAGEVAGAAGAQGPGPAAAAGDGGDDAADRQTEADVRQAETPGPAPGSPRGPERQVTTTSLREDTSMITYLLLLPPRVPLLF